MKIFCVDAESDSLYGDIFAIGAVVYDGYKEIDYFNGSSQVSEVKDQWVIKNVIPNIKHINKYNSRYELRNKFWEFYMKYREDSIIVADCPYPVEYNLFKKCINDDFDNRKWLGPYPFMDIASVLFIKGIEPLKDRDIIINKQNILKHNPLEDARTSAKVLIKILQGKDEY